MAVRDDKTTGPTWPRAARREGVLACLALCLTGRVVGDGEEEEEQALPLAARRRTVQSPALTASMFCVLACMLGACASGDTDSLSASGPGSSSAAPAGSNVSFGGAQDVGFFREQLERGAVPTPESLDAAGFFAEHHIQLPPPSCGNRVCLQPMVAVMGNLMNGANCTMLHLGLNSTIVPDASERPALSLAVVVDVSGSMQGQKLEMVREGLRLLIDGMRDTDSLSLITYSDAGRVVVPMGLVGEQRLELGRAVSSLTADGGTNLWGGLELGYVELQENFDAERQNRVILISDGNPTAGTVEPEEIIPASAGYNSEGIGLTTIGLGSDFNVDLMRSLAQQADGNFYFVEDAGAVDEVFAEELSYFTVPIAFDLELTLQAGKDYEFGRAYGAPLWQDTASGGLLEVPSVFVAHRESDRDVTETDGRRGGGSSLLVELMPRATDAGEDTTIAKVQVSYREPGSDERVSEIITLRYPHPHGTLQRRGFFEADDVRAAQKSFVMLNILVGMQNVLETFHAGRADEVTVGELDSLIAAVEDYNEEIDDLDIELDLELLNMLRANLVSNGVTAEESAPIEDAWPAD